MLLARETVSPPAGAVAVRVTVEVTGVPPATELDDTTMLASQGVIGAVVAVELAHPGLDQ